ncbi:hypothetical protein GCM10025865_31190 [Paraoerskovia sediminicola]|uniref:Cytochrome bc1 complex Rieske iron-sulfur subunit n=1 Tax=Paraoerskovia sediminicola TaxID=1138587 RepID=A0ABM8G6N3_9CELL|nr:Rieske (2Fe-2S) protein [Paraoerskovia sediminicola]BDZ43820.1 hypothetical protein GCM10025865_31190 [Paraoerskovia sediminicola]
MDSDTQSDDVLERAHRCTGRCAAGPGADVPSGPTRRAVVAGAGAGAGALVLAACGVSSGGGASSGSETAGGAPPSSDAPSEDPSGGAAAASLVALADVPVGGAIAVETSDGVPLLVTQPTEGEVHAFSAVCTHQGCTVAPDGDALRCPCHASSFALADGSVESGPAPEPLPEVPVEVSGGDVVLA